MLCNRDAVFQMMMMMMEEEEAQQPKEDEEGGEGKMKMFRPIMHQHDADS